MSKLRSVNTHFWNDNYIVDLDPIEKLLFLYLLTNPNTNMLGVYELHLRKISFDTGIDKDMVKKIFDRFNDSGKASYVDGYVCLHNFTKHQAYNGNMKVSAINSYNDLPQSVKNKEFIGEALKALKPLPKGSEPIAEIEYEIERELEEESEEETDIKDQKIIDVISDVDSISDKDILLALHIWSDVNDLRPDNKTTQRAKVGSWSDPIRLMIERDDRTHEQIWKLWKRVQRDDFWQSNILSTSKLREKFDQLNIKLNKGSNNGKFVDKLFAKK